MIGTKRSVCLHVFLHVTINRVADLMAFSTSMG